MPVIGQQPTTAGTDFDEVALSVVELEFHTPRLARAVRFSAANRYTLETALSVIGMRGPRHK